MSEKPNIVLVHGAWADGSSWSAVIESLQADGYTVTAPQFPETSLANDVARLRQVCDVRSLAMSGSAGFVFLASRLTELMIMPEVQ